MIIFFEFVLIFGCIMNVMIIIRVLIMDKKVIVVDRILFRLVFVVCDCWEIVLLVDFFKFFIKIEFIW